MANFIVVDAFVLEQLVNQLNRLIEAFRQAVTRVVNADNAEFNDSLENFEDNIIQILNAGTLGDSLNTLFTDYLIVGNTSLDQYLLSRELFTFGDNDTPNQLSLQEIENTKTVNNAVQIYSLSSAFDSASQIEFGNEQDLETIKMELSDQFEKLVKTDIDDDTRVSLLDMKTSTFDFFSNLDLKSIVTVNTTQLPSTVLSYRYYGTSTRADEIIQLNNILNTGFVEGDIEIVSAS